MPLRGRTADFPHALSYPQHSRRMPAACRTFSVSKLHVQCFLRKNFFKKFDTPSLSIGSVFSMRPMMCLMHIAGFDGSSHSTSD